MLVHALFLCCDQRYLYYICIFPKLLKNKEHSATLLRLLILGAWIHCLDLLAAAMVVKPSLREPRLILTDPYDWPCGISRSFR